MTRSPTAHNASFRPLFAAVVCGLLVALTSMSGAIARPDAWYAALDHPIGTPPDIAFPIAWTVLYIFMAIAAWRVWRAVGIGLAFGLFVLQLVLNALWMPVAFGAESLVGALIVVAALWLTVAATTGLFFRADRVAGGLFLVYLVWVSYALYLNIGLVWLNTGVFS